MLLEGCACRWGPFPGASVGSQGLSTLMRVRTRVVADCWGPSWEPWGAGVCPSDTVVPPLTNGAWCLPQWCLRPLCSGATRVLCFSASTVWLWAHDCVVMWSSGGARAGKRTVCMLSAHTLGPLGLNTEGACESESHCGGAHS